eukprot:827827-Pyramimonas_sp.AAC.2
MSLSRPTKLPDSPVRCCAHCYDGAQTTSALWGCLIFLSRDCDWSTGEVYSYRGTAIGRCLRYIPLRTTACGATTASCQVVSLFALKTRMCMQ